MEDNILSTILREVVGIKKELKRLDAIEEKLKELDPIKEKLKELDSMKEQLDFVSGRVVIMENNFGAQIKALFSDVYEMNKDDHKLLKSST